MQIPFKIVLSIIAVTLLSCNKNTDQLPVVKSPPNKLVISNKTNGINDVDFVFEQTQTAQGDTVWLSIKNNTNSVINNLVYVVELCEATPKTFTNCDLQVANKLSDQIPAGATQKKVFTWINKGIKLNASLINTGIISYTGLVAQPNANVYDFGSATFEGATQFTGLAKGYILADGAAIFRLKARNDVQQQYVTDGLFLQATSYDGSLQIDDKSVTPFAMDALIGSSNQNLEFKLKLDNPIPGNITSIKISANKKFF